MGAEREKPGDGGGETLRDRNNNKENCGWWGTERGVTEKKKRHNKRRI